MGDDFRPTSVTPHMAGLLSAPVNGVAIRFVTYLPALIGPMAYLAPMGLTPLLALLALAVIAASWRGTRAEGRGTGMSFLQAGLAAWPLLLVGLLSATWSISPAVSLGKTGQLAGLLVMGVLFVPALAVTLPIDRTRLLSITMSGFLVAATLVLADLALDGGLSAWARPVPEGTLAASYSRGAATHAIFGVPLFLGLWRFGRRRLALVSLTAALMPFGLEQASAQLALLVAVIVALTVFAVPVLRWLLLAAQLSFVLAIPLALPYDYAEHLCPLIDTKASIVHRVVIWNFAHERWSERPTAGWGLASARHVPGGDGYADFITPCGREVTTLHDGRPNLPQLLPLHTHNAPVQVWLELGIFGALALAWLIAMLSWKGYAVARDRAGMAATAGLSAAFFVVAVVSFGAWQSWWWAAMLLALGVTGAALQSSGGKPSADAR